MTVLSDDGGSGGGTSKPVFSGLSLAKATDALSPTLLKWAIAGTGVGTDIQTGPNGNLFVVSMSNGNIYEIYRRPR